LARRSLDQGTATVWTPPKQEAPQAPAVAQSAPTVALDTAAIEAVREASTGIWGRMKAASMRLSDVHGLVFWALVGAWVFFGPLPLAVCLTSAGSFSVASMLGGAGLSKIFGSTLITYVGWKLLLPMWRARCARSSQPRAPSWAPPAQPATQAAPVARAPAPIVAQKLSEDEAVAMIAKLNEQVVGQPRVVAEQVKQYRRRLAQVDRTRALSVDLFVGPPGVGKTHLVKQFAQAVGRPLLPFDMTQCTESHSAQTMFGSPKGYAGGAGTLTTGLAAKPNAVVLLDEAEKAHADVLRRFLVAFDSGYVVDASNGAQFDTRNAMFVMTTNAAYEAIVEAEEQIGDDYEELRRVCTSLLREAGYPPELLSRIDQIQVFSPIKGMDAAKVAAITIDGVVRSYGMKLEFIDPAILMDIVARQEKLGSGGARDIVKLVERQCSDGLMRAQDAQAKSIELMLNADNEIVVTYSN